MSELYLDLLRDALTGELGLDGAVPEWKSIRWTGVRGLVNRAVERRGLRLVTKAPTWKVPRSADTMIGRAGLNNVLRCVETVLADEVPGDLIETGVWRGGACIFMRGILKAHGVRDRTVWVADSFAGLPEPDPAYAADAGDVHSEAKFLAVSADEVRDRFNRYGLLDEQVRFLEGWFADTLPTAPIEEIAVARLDGDMYGSTWDAITALYPKLSPGGFLIVDDYNAIDACKQAIEDYRTQERIVEPIVDGNFHGVHWRKL